MFDPEKPVEPAELVEFFVFGEPATQGSKRAFFRKGMKFPVIVDDCKRNKPWREDVRAAALNAVEGRSPVGGPVSLILQFFLPRPKGHFRAGDREKGLKESAPRYPTGKPDAVKLARAVEDSLKGVVWNDDSQVVDERILKRYSVGNRVGVSVTVRRVKGEDDE